MNKLMIAIVMFAVLLWGTWAFAETRQPDPGKALTLETLTVTAQKQEENQQDVPVSISVYDASTIEDKNVESLLGLAQYIPNVMLFQNGHPGNVSPSFRGINAPGTSLSVAGGLYIDGVPILLPAGYESDLLDVERVEVLRGPQGTIYGKGAEAGVINIVSKMPGNEFHGRTMLVGGEDKKGQVIFNLRGPIVEDRLYFSLAGNFDRKNGFVKHTVTQKIVDDRENKSGRAQLRWTPTDDLDISLIAASRRDHNDAVRMNVTSLGAAMMGGTPQRHRVSSSLEGYERPETDSQALKVAYDINNDLTLTSITSHWLYKDIAQEDFDFGPAMVFETHKNSRYRTVSEELRLDYSTEQLKWLFGLYYERAKNDIDYWVGSVVPAMAGTTSRDISGNTYAGFTNVTYALTEQLGLIGGLRYEVEKQTFKDNMSGFSTDESWSALSPKIALEYKFLPTLMTYASVAKGCRSGSFNWAATNPQYYSYDQEELWSYELGVKSEFLDNRLIVNGALFYMDISDMQVEESITPALVYTTNAAKATSRGVELEMAYLITKGLKVNAGYGYIDTSFKKFKDVLGDYKDNRVPFAPNHTFTVGADYRHDSGWYVGADVTACGKMYLDKANKYSRDGYALVNAKIGYEMEHMNVYLYTKNLFNEEYNANGYMNGMYTMYSEPREVGLQLVCHF